MKRADILTSRLVLLVGLVVLMLAATVQVWADATVQPTDTLTVLNELRAENELLQQRSRFTTGGLAMILIIAAMLVFLVINNRWNHRLEIKNRQLERERNVVVAQNKQLAIERDRAEAALKAKTAFMQSMTHEIRTPLNGISGFTQVLTMPDIDLPQAEKQKLSTNIQENIRLLTNILDDLLLISDLEGHWQLPTAEQTSATGIITQAVETVMPQKPATVTFDLPYKKVDDLLITTYPHMVQTILVKLLDNAVKFTKAGSITINFNNENGMVRFSVSDTGPGIPADKKDVIFERFSKLDSFIQGTGLGLFIARMSAERIGGQLTLDTSYSGGAKFDLFIPINPQQKS
ncbi:MAG: HAMP domain-containing histidine kinase [Prevotella sp.]|nr:HAMP domain-containing histidine kinase [Prevotella sp.]